ncbi:TlpA disulfide reductase family protein [uncultured Algibacter sp.]|uniref:TlpA family protein disulfide reductase n=1 Tax=uncultured Algibacter sp. TaxID=298659 RepID=UPI00260D5D3A|nr:TlpA disulfide reductase family protein [uncultured Algibacter sp.]
MKTFKSKFKNIVFLVVLALFLIPQTRQPIQVLLNKGLALFSPSITKKSEQIIVSNYNWNLQDINGGGFHFEEVKGKVVLVNFWATWCPPCIAEMPSLHKLYQAYNDKIEFVFISNEDLAVIRKFLNQEGYTFKVYRPLTQYPEAFDVNTIPRTFLVDKKGNIIIDKTGAANWNSEMVRKTIDALIEEEN